MEVSRRSWVDLQAAPDPGLPQRNFQPSPKICGSPGTSDTITSLPRPGPGSPSQEGGQFLGRENLPEQGPAVFVSNHLGAIGPIGVAASLPLKMHFWIQEAMLDPGLAADYLRCDFVEPQLHIPPPYSRPVAKGLSKLSVPLLRASGGVPVGHAADTLLETYRSTLDLLEAGRFLLIFPEDPSQSPDPRTKMSAFQKGFTRLGELYYQRTQRILQYYPVMVHAGERIVRLERPIRYNPMNRLTSERIRLKHLLESTIKAMYLEAESRGGMYMPQTN